MEHRVYWSHDFIGRCDKKRQKLNEKCTNVYLLPDGSIFREEDKIIAVQRIWRERAYAPPGTLFEKRGCMYRKALMMWPSLMPDGSCFPDSYS
jgi:hypothetical protein